jgi:hypothetical protein
MPTESVSSIRLRTSEGIVPILSIVTLRQYCLVNASVTADSTVKMCPGILMQEAPITTRRMINSTYGITKHDAETKEQVATCGFSIEDNVMVISNTPQGKNPSRFESNKVRRRFAKSSFRIEMMQVMMDIAKNLKLSGIKGFPVDDKYGPVPERLYRAVNELFELFGFDLIPDDMPYYFYSLASQYQ